MQQKRSSVTNIARFFYQYLFKPALLGLVVAALVLAFLHFREQSPQPRTAIVSSDLISFSSAFEHAAPAVVNIYTTQSVREARFSSRPTTVMRLGSGIIMDPRGFILTALHVVQDVDEIQVALQDGRIFGAQLVGSDLLTDLAVLRIDAGNLPVIPVNPDYEPRPGDVVLAIGNPYNLGQTVTQGIISATGRISLGSGYAEFIQMDAAINEGNSGGALVNSRGELVGIASASYQSEFSNRGSQGIYFALSYPLAERIMQQLISEGVVTRGYLGITAGQYYRDDFSTRGLRIDEVDERGPAWRAGLRPGDFIFEIAGQAVTSVNQGLDLVAEARPGTRLNIRFYRGEEQLETDVVIEQLR
ncbi:MAG: trypsin-like peptidase domain-containing protein [Aliidiomarina sp.]|uniref:trypsin-like peptidase domain-containing protein n=1 Tax=Aliidiomarina sp. TaxID=1872439 RepID=UPI0025BBAE05|nr:trypsin-like peptidase domain-containing protein [Aliidiomarina sp.]MCH8501261.1 trypsin-like peptidase domain-containing protein [Aliidiomarina sp.]